MRNLGRLALAMAAAAICAARADLVPGDAFPRVGPGAGAGALVPGTEGRVLLVDFWASWCAPCRASFPAYGRLYAEYAPKGLVIIGVGEDEDPGKYASFLRKYSPHFPVVLDQGQQLVARVGVPTMPTSYLIDRRGRVRFVLAGYHGAETDRAVRRDVEILLSER